MIISGRKDLKLALCLSAVAMFVTVKGYVSSRYHDPQVVTPVETTYRAELTNTLKRTIGFTSHNGRLLADYSVLGAERQGPTTKAYLLAMTSEFVRKPDGQLELASGTWMPVVAEIVPGKLIGIQRPMDGGDFRRTFEAMVPFLVRDEWSWKKRTSLMESHIRQQAADYFNAS